MLNDSVRSVSEIPVAANVRETVPQVTLTGLQPGDRHVGEADRRPGRDLAICFAAPLIITALSGPSSANA
jgi:hypothetical protein